MDLITGHVKKVKNFTQVPMPDGAIKTVNNWGKKHLKEKKIQGIGVPDQAKKSVLPGIMTNVMKFLMDQKTPKFPKNFQV